MELTWITFPTIVVTVSLLAYYAAYVVKGTDLRVNKIDVVDIDLESEGGPGDELDQPVQPAEPRLLGRGRADLARPRAAGRLQGRRRAPAGDRGPPDLVRRPRRRPPGDEHPRPRDGLRRRRLQLRPDRQGRGAGGRPDRDLEHQGVRRPLVRARRPPPGRSSKSTSSPSGHRPPGRDDHQPACRSR